METPKPSDIYLETRYTGATDRGGAVISIYSLQTGKRRARYAYDYAAPNPHIAAIEKYIEPYFAESIESMGYSKRGNMYRIVVGGVIK